MCARTGAHVIKASGCVVALHTHTHTHTHAFWASLHEACGLVVPAGEAKLVVQGALLGAQQDASVLVTDFPMAMLQPMFRAVPALQHAAPAVGSGSPSAPGGPAAAFLNSLTLPVLK